ncbi:MAG TPA: peptidylprolyl isomerase [Gammaproteobacteria bacterium]
MTHLFFQDKPVKKARYLTRVAREPLFQFVVLGALLFFVYYLFNDDSAATNPRKIIVDQQEIKRLSQQFRRTWMRPPTNEELDGLVNDFIKEEILYREALALGLDKGDLVIRRRMRQKMEFLNEDLVQPPEPTDMELQQFLDTHMDSFREPVRISFSQIFINQGEKATQRASRLLAKLKPGAEITNAKYHGDPTLLPRDMKRASSFEISRTFGNQFTEAILGAPEGEWSGPYVSGYGLHIIYLAKRFPGSEPSLTEVRKEVQSEWEIEQQRKINNRFYDALRERYSIEVRYPDSSSGTAFAETDT